MKKNLTVIKNKNDNDNAPTKQVRDYADFDRWVEHAERLSGYLKNIGEEAEECEEKKEVWFLQHALRGKYSREKLKAELEKYYDWYEVYDPDDAYDRPDGRWQLKRHIIAEQVGLLIGSFPNGVPHNPEIYMRMLVEELAAAHARAPELESACRYIRRNHTFIPAPAEFLTVLKKMGSRWADLYGFIEPADWIEDREARIKDTLDRHDEQIAEITAAVAALEKAKESAT
jgi:hypothetical protein